MEHESKPWDVVIVGAGVSGLAAAERLGEAGLRVLVLESRDRVGGRLFSLPGLNPAHAIDLGAEFVHGKPKEFDDYLKRHNLELQETVGNSYCATQHGLEKCDEPASEVFDQLEKMKLGDFPDETFDTTLRCRFPNAASEGKAWARWFVQGFHAGDPARISTHSIIRDSRAEEETEGDRGFHVVGGYSRVVEALCHDLGQRWKCVPALRLVGLTGNVIR